MSNRFTIESPAQVPWHFYDERDGLTFGHAPDLHAAISTRDGRTFYAAVGNPNAVTSSRIESGLASAVAAVLEMGDTIACEMSSRAGFETSRSSNTASFSQVRENSGADQ